MSSIACRICLSIESRKQTILHTPLQAVYERITNIPLDTGDGRPVTVCYVCCRQLEKCGNLIEKSMEADTQLKRILSHGVEITESAICALPKRPAFPNLTITHNKVLSVGLPLEHEVTIKVEVKPDDEAVTEESIQNLSSNGPDLLVEHSSLGYQVENDGLITAIKQEEKIDDTDPEVGSDDSQEEVWCKEQMQITKSSICAVPQRTEFPNLNGTHLKVLSVGPLAEREVPIKDEVDAENLSSNCPGLLVEHSSLNCQVVNDELITAMKQEEKIVETDIGLEDAEQNVRCKPVSTESNPNMKAALLDIPEIAESPSENSQTPKTERIIDKTLSQGNICDECGNSFKTKLGLSRHRYHRQHLGSTNKNKCQYCGIIYAERYKLNHHIRLEHTKEALYHCDYCTKKFVKKPYYKKHLERYHLEELNEQYNDNGGTTSMKLNNDIEPTQTRKMFNCRYCKKRFYRFVKLRMHLKEHTNITFDCDHCGKSYKRRVSLVYHMRSHYPSRLGGRTRLYHCNLCSTQFTEKRGFKLHMRRHYSHVKASLKRHTGKKPYRCDYCEKSYKYRKCLIDHINFTHYNPASGGFTNMPLEGYSIIAAPTDL